MGKLLARLLFFVSRRAMRVCHGSAGGSANKLQFCRALECYVRVVGVVEVKPGTYETPAVSTTALEVSVY